MRLRPIRFLFAVAFGWAALRAMMLWPVAGHAKGRPHISWVRPLPSGPAPVRFDRRQAISRLPRTTPPLRILRLEAGVTQPSDLLAYSPEAPALRAEAAPPSPTERLVSPVRPPVWMPDQAPSPGRFHISGWAIVRRSGSGGLAAAGQLGGSQAGLRMRYDMAPGLAGAIRISGPIGSPQGREAAIAIDWRPVDAVPITLTIERRTGFDRGARDAFAAGVYGGVGGVPLPLGTELDGYAQAGLVGLKRRDAYFDGAARIERAVMTSRRTRIGAGVGLWGGAQPGVSRLDIGPQLVVHVPAGPGVFRIAAEWRERIAGNASPGSGPALSIGADF